MTSHSIQKTIETPKAKAYASQLGKHFSHKIRVECFGNSMVFHFSQGIGRVDVNGDRLTMTASACNPEQMHSLAHVLGAHLERFAFRENLQLGWAKPSTTIEGKS
ncbi:DUF2218 domain-containing protein [Phaeobacter sp. CNT1-3]|nr:DUF2218 domain-containing protein [Phaeobacter sp. CNT1-3]